MFTFKKEVKTKEDVYRQIDAFVEYKKKRSVWKANSHREHLLLFVRATRVENVFDITPEIENEYEVYLNQRYNSEFLIKEAQNSLNCFKRFYRVY